MWKWEWANSLIHSSFLSAWIQIKSPLCDSRGGFHLSWSVLHTNLLICKVISAPRAGWCVSFTELTSPSAKHTHNIHICVSASCLFVYPCVSIRLCLLLFRRTHKGGKRSLAKQTGADAERSITHTKWRSELSGASHPCNVCLSPLQHTRTHTHTHTHSGAHVFLFPPGSHDSMCCFLAKSSRLVSSLGLLLAVINGKKQNYPDRSDVWNWGIFFYMLKD